MLRFALVALTFINSSFTLAETHYTVECEYSAVLRSHSPDRGILKATISGKPDAAFKKVVLFDIFGNKKETLFDKDTKCGRVTENYTNCSGVIDSPIQTLGLGVVYDCKAQDIYKEGYFHSVLSIRNEDNSGLFQCNHFLSSLGSQDAYSLELTNCLVR